MIHPLAEAHPLAEKVLVGTTGGALAAGSILAQANPYLQNIAWIVAAISGVCAAVYYLVMTIAKIREMRKP